MIYLVDYVHAQLLHVDQWRTLIPDMLVRHGYDVQVLSGDVVPSSDQLLGDTMYQAVQYRQIYELLISNKLTKSDIIIFADAWNPNAISVKLAREKMNGKFMMIGVWRDGMFDINSRIWETMWGKPKRWISSFEKALFWAYDYNCFFDQDTRDRFVRKHIVKVRDTAVATGFPIQDVQRYASEINSERSDIVVLPHDTVNDEQADIFRALKRYLHQFEFIDCKQRRYSRIDYYKLLSTAKVVLAINPFEPDPTPVYEAMVFGCIPLVPNCSTYQHVFQSQYHYPAHYIQPPFLNFVRGREVLHQRLRVAINEYDSLVRQLKHDVDEITNIYFSNESFLKLLERIHELNKFTAKLTINECEH